MTGYPPSIVPAGHVAPVPRRVRAMLGGEVVLDTRHARYLWEWPPYPQFLIPAEDVAPGAVADQRGTRRTDFGDAAEIALTAAGVTRTNAGWRYDASPIEGVAGTIRFEWAALDAWFEEDEQIFVHPRNPYSRVDALRTRRAVRIELDGVVLAESGAAVTVFETGLPPRHYLDRSAIDFTRLRASPTETACPYKGRTSAYWSAETGGGLHPDVAWSYDFPTRELLPIAGLVAFYDEKVDVFLDGERQPRPQTPFSRSASS